jgi:predicted alpha/beta superfamily hydrolase
MTRTIAVAAAVVFALLAARALAATPIEPDSSATGVPVVIKSAQQIDFTSKINGRSYRLFIAGPPLLPPSGGYPVLYVLDGNAHFGTAVETARLQSYSPGVAPAVVVAIGYPTDDRPDIEKRRAFDLTLPAAKDVGALLPGMTPADFGGLDAFLEVLENEIKPRAAFLYKVDPAQAALFGHSFGGMAVLHALFKRPGAFRTFIASSPTIYWADRVLLSEEPQFVRRVEQGSVAPRILITVGGEESTPWKSLPSANPFTLDQVNSIIRSLRMVEEARAMAERLAAVDGPPAYEAVGVVFAGEGHLSQPPAAISRAVRFAFGER